MRAEHQVLVLGYIKSGIIKYLVMEREDLRIWQFVSGGGESDEIPVESASREFLEETGKDIDGFIKLDTMASIPAYFFKEHRNKSDLYVVPEFSFAVELFDEKIKLSDEHISYKFLPYEECREMLKYDSNRTALYELNERLKRETL